MTLFLLRHGEAAQTGAGTLTAAGVAAVRRVAAQARERGVQIAKIVHSPTPRTVETARILAEELGPCPVVASVLLSPDAAAAPLISGLVSETVEERDVVFVSHLPTIAALTAELLGHPIEPGLAELTAISRSGRSWRIDWSLRPD